MSNTIKFLRVDAEEYLVLLNGREIGFLERDQRWGFVSASSRAQKVTETTWNFTCFDFALAAYGLPDAARGDDSGFEIPDLGHLSAAKAAIRSFFAERS